MITVFLDSLVTVEAVITPRVTSTTANQALLICAMRDYVRPDDHFQWFRRNNKLPLGDKYSVLYADGLLQAQNGMATRSPTRVTGLFITNPDVSDAGSYTCAVNETLAIVELIVNGRYTIL